MKKKLINLLLVIFSCLSLTVGTSCSFSSDDIDDTEKNVMDIYKSDCIRGRNSGTHSGTLN